MTFSVSYIFQARDQFSAVARKVKKQTKGLRSQFKGLRAQLTRTNTAFKKTSSTMSSGFRKMAAAAIGFFGAREFIRAGSEFQTSLADLSAITGAVGDDFDLLKSKTLALAKASVTSQAEVAQSIKLVASAKPELLANLPLLIKTTEQILLLKNASGLDLATAAKVGAESLNIFGKSAEFAGKFVNILAAGSKFGSSEVANTGQAVLIAGPAARSAGLSFLQLNAAIQALALGGSKGSQAGTALNAILGRLRRQGLDIQKLGLEKTFTIVGNALDAETDSTKRALLEAKLFGEEHAKAGLILVANAALLGKFKTILAGTNVAQEQANIRLATFDAISRGLGITIRDKLIRVFLKLAPTFEKIAASATNFIDSITPQQVEIFADGLKRFTLASVEVVKQLSTQLIPFVKDLFKVISTANAAGLASDIFSIAEAISIILIPIKILAALLKGLFVSFEKLTFLVKGDFKKAFDTSFFEAATIGGKFLGIFDREKAPATIPAAPTVIPAPVSAPSVAPISMLSQAEIDVNINAPDGVVESVKTKRTGNTNGMDLGVNMSSAA